MKKASPGDKIPETINEYLEGVPEPHRATLEKLRKMIRAAAPKDTVEAISYRIPTFKYKGSLVGFAAFKKHCSFFPMSASIVGQLQAELTGYQTSKGTIQFAIDQPPPAALVRKIVRMRVAENDEK